MHTLRFVHPVETSEFSTFGRLTSVRTLYNLSIHFYSVTSNQLPVFLSKLMIMGACAGSKRGHGEKDKFD